MTKRIKTKIIATVGPSSQKKSVLRRMILAGMDLVRINMSHGRHEEHKIVIDNIRELSQETKRPIGIILDLRGPKIRTGKLKDGRPVYLKRGSVLRITTKEVLGDETQISTTYKGLIDDVEVGDRILLDNGTIELRVIDKEKDSILCKVTVGGILGENKGINLPGVSVSVPSVTEKDKKDIEFGVKNRVDYFAISFVRDEENVKEVKRIISSYGADIPVIAKIEKPEAVKNIEKILQVSDGIMVARGDLGVEIRPEQVPEVQKILIQKAIIFNKPVITATQMLESMTLNPFPTRAEASDVANAIYDGTDAVMLSEETAIGRYPVKAVQMMAKIALKAENSPFMRYNLRFDKEPEDIVYAVARSAVNILHDINAKAIIVFSVSGRTAKLISRYRPKRPIFSFSPDRDVYNRLSLVWGITPLIIPPIHDTRRIIEKGEEIILRKGILKKDDLVVLVTGLALKAGSTNLIKIHRMGHKD